MIVHDFYILFNSIFLVLRRPCVHVTMRIRSINNSGSRSCRRMKGIKEIDDFQEVSVNNIIEILNLPCPESSVQ